MVDRQLTELREAQRVHETFTELSFGQAGPVEILQAVQRMAAGPVVVENAQHRPLDYFAGPDDAGGFLDGWPARSRRVEVAGRTGWDAANGWLVTRLGTADQVWGRLVIGSPQPPSQRLVAVAERAAAALALHRLHDRDRGTLMRRTHLELLSGLADDPDSDDVLRRCELAGFPVRRRSFAGRGGAAADRCGVAGRPRRGGGHGRPRRARPAAAGAGLRGRARPAGAGLGGSRRPTPTTSSTGSRPASSPTTTSSSPPGGWWPTGPRIARSVTEAGQVADAAPQVRREHDPDVHRLADLHLRGLLALLGEDDRLRLFADRELAALKQHDRAEGARTDLLAALRALVMHPASKTEAAASLHLSRAAFYDRLARIEKILDADLDDPDVRVSLHVALLADESVAGRSRTSPCRPMFRKADSDRPPDRPADSRQIVGARARGR